MKAIDRVNSANPFWACSSNGTVATIFYFKYPMDFNVSLAYQFTSPTDYIDCKDIVAESDSKAYALIIINSRVFSV